MKYKDFFVESFNSIYANENRRRKLVFKLKSGLFSIPFMFASLGLSKSYASEPTDTDLGIPVGEIIVKSELTLISGPFKMQLGQNQEIAQKFADEYGGKGTVYYSTDGKTWSATLPSFDTVGPYTLYYYVIGNENYGDLGSENDPKILNVTVYEEGTYQKDSLVSINGPVAMKLGQNQEIAQKFADEYGGKGTVYYSTDRQTWSTTLPSFDSVGLYTLYYYVTGNESYTDLGSANNPMSLNITVYEEGTDPEYNLVPIRPVTMQLGQNQELAQRFADAYGGKGTVYYSTDRQTWSTTLPTFDTVGSHTLYYYVVGNENYNDLGSANDPMSLSITVTYSQQIEPESGKSSWGDKQEIRNGITHYINESEGETSVEVDKTGVIWLQETSDGMSSWYGIDNSSGTFALGSRFYVRWLTPGNRDYDTYFPKSEDDSSTRRNRPWLFLTGVKSPDGVDYKDLEKAVPYYIQVDNPGGDWSAGDAQAFYKYEEGDGVQAKVDSGTSFNSQNENINIPDTSSNYAQLLLKNFKPYPMSNAPLSALSVDSINLTYKKGGKQTLEEFNTAYGGKGTVYYKIGENGSWVSGIPSFDKVGTFDLYYYVVGGTGYNDVGSESDPLYVKVQIEVDKSDWGSTENNIRGGITHYVKTNGETSVEVTGDGVTWLQEESIDHYDAEGNPVILSSWYGIDNSAHVFATGSRFYVNWLEPGDTDYEYYFDKLDPTTKTKVKDGKLWIFLTGVISPDGDKYEKLSASVPYYIQIGTDWNENDINVVYISDEKDEVISREISTIAEFNKKYGDLNYPGTTGSDTRFGRLLLRHFSPYSLMEQLATETGVDKEDIVDALTELGATGLTSGSSGSSYSSASGLTSSGQSGSTYGSASGLTSSGGDVSSLLTGGLGVSTGSDIDNSQITKMTMLLIVLAFLKLKKKREE